VVVHQKSTVRKKKDRGTGDAVTGKIVYIDHELSQHKNVFLVNWNLGNRCNFRCSYCNESLNGGSSPWPEAATVTAFADRVIDHYGADGGKKILFGFTGGEVTLYKDLIPVLQYLKTRNCHTEILSNGSPRRAFWNKITDVLDYAILSYHAEHCRPDHFYSVVDAIRGETNVHVNIMMNRERFDVCRELGESILRLSSGISLSFQPLLERLDADAKLIPYTPDQLETIRTLNDNRGLYYTGDNRYRGRMLNYTADGDSFIMEPEQYVTEKRNHWKGWLCWTGVEQIVVSQKGEVFRAWCMQEKIGDIGGTVAFPTKPVLCTKPSCHCNIDMLVKKQRPLYLTCDNIGALLRMGIVS